MDFYILFIPIPTVLALQMTLRRKITILAVLAFGMVSVTVANIRLPVLVSVTSMKTNASIDVGKMIIVASFAVQCAIVAVNLPSLKSLWTQVKRRLTSAGSGDTSSDQPQMLSSLKVGSRKRGTMGSITRLNREISRNESEEGLCQSISVQAYPHAEELQFNAELNSQKPGRYCSE